MRTAKQFAEVLNGREHGNELSKDEAQAAKEANLVVVFGYSDDNMEFRGAIYDEISCYDGGVAYLTCDGLVKNKCDHDDCPYYQKEKDLAETITATWNKDGEEFAWVYETTIPHEVFNIFDDGEPHCKGIVFDLRDVTSRG